VKFCGGEETNFSLSLSYKNSLNINYFYDFAQNVESVGRAIRKGNFWLEILGGGGKQVFFSHFLLKIH